MNYLLSDEEEADIEALGGFEHCRQIADKILFEHGFHRSFFLKSDIKELHCRKNCSVRGPVNFNFDPGKSLQANIDELLVQAHGVQNNAGGTNYVGAMLQHLVGAKLDVVLGEGKIIHHGFSVADRSTDRKGDFQIESVAVHVTTHPSEALIRKCADNLGGGLKPVIVTIGDGVLGAAFLLRNAELTHRVDVLDASQFLTANVLERSLFRVEDCKITLTKLLKRYNEIVSTCETDPTLKVAFGKED